MSFTPAALAAPRRRTRRTALLVAAALVAGSVGIAGVTGPAGADATPLPLTGLFQLAAGTWNGTATTGHAGGTYFRMIQPGSTASNPTYLANANSRAANQTYTILNPGTDGGLRTGVYQPDASPAFASNGDALTSSVIAPETFFGVKFSVSTNKVDPQTGLKPALPAITATGTTLSGDLSALSASWNTQFFNQGAPKPDGTTPGLTQAVSGSYNPSTLAFTITWRSLIVGGPFDGFTGEWHLAGTFVPNVQITTASLPGALIGTAYSAKLAASGGKNHFKWSLFAGTLPDGLKLAASGAIKGHATTAGTSTFTVEATDTSKPKNVAVRQLTLTVAPFTVATSSLPAGTVGTAYPATTLAANGGKGKLTWTLSSGSLPPGLKFSSSGKLTGTPTAAGSYPITVQVSDSSNPKNVASRALTIAVGA